MESERGTGWTAFAGVMIMLVGFMNVIYGIAAIDNSTFYTQDAKYLVFDDLNTWGWFMLIVGVAQLFAAFSIWSRNPYGRVIGIATASVNAVIMLLWISAYPLAALALFAIDILVIYGLVAYGSDQAAARTR